MKNKNCPTCKTVKAIDRFSKDATRPDGFRGACKDCTNESDTKARRTKDGLAAHIYKRQKQSSKKRGHPQPSYTKVEFVKWCLDQDKFHGLYADWVSSDYSKWQVPSADRLDDYKPYSFENIQLVSYQYNFDKGNKDRKEGRNNKISKGVNCYGMDDMLIKKYPSIRSASRDTGISSGSIGNVCRGDEVVSGTDKDGNPAYYIPRTAGGYKWSFDTPINNQGEPLTAADVGL